MNLLDTRNTHHRTSLWARINDLLIGPFLTPSDKRLSPRGAEGASLSGACWLTTTPVPAPSRCHPCSELVDITLIKQYCELRPGNWYQLLFLSFCQHSLASPNPYPVLRGGNDLLNQQHQLFNYRASFLDHFLHPMNIYGGFEDEKSDQCQKHSGDEGRLSLKGRRQRGWPFDPDWKEAGAADMILAKLVLIS